jgi:mono/diheme cytochrome c family protein
MRVWKRVVIIGLVALACLVLIALSLLGWQPLVGPKTRPLTDRKFDQTAGRRERGQYLVEAVAHCTYCHSELDWSAQGAPPQPGKEMGGRVWTLQGMPWLVSPNLTPDLETGAASWTDDMLARSIREGIGHDGRALFTTMPYQYFRYMSDEDLASVITYIRSIKPVHNILPKTKIPFPTSRLILSAPEPITSPVSAPDTSNPVMRGEYLVRISTCIACHTVQNDGQVVKGLEFAGGFVFQTPLGVLASPNITPDPSGISYYDEAMFLSVIRTGHVRARKLNPEMPWGYFRNMSDEDLRAIFAYLRTLKPIKHAVDNTEPPTYCRICRQMHGLGDRN